MEKNKKRIFFKVVSKAILILVINFIILLGALQLSSVQTSLGKTITSNLSQNTGFYISINKISIRWFDRITLIDVRILDPSKQEMITVKKLMVNYRIKSIFNPEKNIVIDEVVLTQPKVALSLSDTSVLNITRFIASLNNYSNRKRDRRQLEISQIEIIDGNFSYNSLSKPYKTEGFDNYHFEFESLHTNVEKFIVAADTIQLTINKLTSIEKQTRIPINSLRCNYLFSKSSMKFGELSSQIGASVIKTSLELHYDQIINLSQFTTKVMIKGHFDKLKLYTQDLKNFAPYFKPIYDTLNFIGDVNGYINDFRTNQFDLQFGSMSHIQGNAYFEGLPDILNTFIDLKVKNATIYNHDLAIYIPSENFQKYNPIESAEVEGFFTGYPKDFVANASFKTSIGFIQTDLNLKIPSDPREATYSGSLKLLNLELDKISDSNAYLGKTTLNGTIKGAGLTFNNADFKLNSQIAHTNIYGYTYKHIQTNAHFANGLFDGFFKINDPNLVFNVIGKVDLRTNVNTISLIGELEKANLDSLKLSNKVSSLAAKFKVELTGIHLDSIEGNVAISDLKASNNDQIYQFEELLINSNKTKNERSLAVKSERVNLQLEGDFNFSSALVDIKNIWNEYKTNFLNQEVDITSFYGGIQGHKPSSNFSFNLGLTDINPFINFFNPLIHLSKNTQIDGRLSSTDFSNLEITFQNDTIIYSDNILVGNLLKINALTNNQMHGVTANVLFNSRQQTISSGTTFDSLSLNANWEKKQINFNVYSHKNSQNNINSIDGKIIFEKDTTYLSLLPSTIKILDNIWQIQNENEIMFTKDRIETRNMSIFSSNQKLSAMGVISKNTNEPIEITAQNIHMSNFKPLLPNSLEGILNGKIEITQIFATPLIESNLSINNFKVDGFLFGNIEGNSKWNNTKDVFDINFFVERNNTKLVTVSGDYKPLEKENALNLKAELINTDLQMIEPFTKRLFSDLKGSLSGEILVKGPLFEPTLVGEGEINNAQIKIIYLNTLFETSGKWDFDANSINLSDMHLSDASIGKGQLNASFRHTNFKDFNIDLSADFDKLIMLNTNEKSNNAYYGTAIATGNLSINGPINNLVISGKAKTEKGTRFFIPLSGSGLETKQEDFIAFASFTNFNDSIKFESTKEKIKIKNITVNLDVEITPDAYAEIIFDKIAGDIIRGTGSGNLSLSIDSKGAFTMIGEYQFLQGAYNFTMYNIVNKEFIISPKSKIVWFGNPYLGDLSINASYNVSTTLTPLIDPAFQESMPEIKIAYPSKVLLSLNGPLLSPDIDFDIIIEDYPKSNVNIDTEVRAFLNKIQNDELEMNRQVFSLLVFRKFQSSNSFSSSGTLGSSVSEFVSNQLSYWISQVDDNLSVDFDFDLGELDKEALQTFQLRVSYAFLDGKLLVTRDGGFTDQNNEATLASITGDWTVEYLLSKDNKLRIKLFKKTNYDQLNSSSGSSENLISGGFSLLYTSSFNDLKEVFNKNKKKNIPKSTNNTDPSSAIKPEDVINIP